MHDDHSRKPSKGRRATHFFRFFAAVHSSLADTLRSSSSCEIHKRRGRPARRLQLLPCLIPVRLSTLSRRTTCADVLGSSRRTWLKSERRLLAIISRTFENLVRRWTTTFVAIAWHWMPRMWCWQVMWNACTHQLSSASDVRVSDSYNSTGRSNTRRVNALSACLASYFSRLCRAVPWWMRRILNKIKQS